jgi:hypothetical protein
VSDELRIGTKDRAIILVLKPKYGATVSPAMTQVIGAAGPFSEKAKEAVATLYDWLLHAKANPS